MRAVLVSRYPRVDTPPWKQRVAAGLTAAGIDVAVVYSRSTLTAHALAGLREEGLGVLARYAALRRTRDTDGPRARSLVDWARDGGHAVGYVHRLDDASIIDDLDPDLLVLVGSDLVPAPVLAIPTLGTINAHYGLLPAYRGMNVTEWSVYRGDPVGVTVHLVDAGVDTGPILLREEIEIEPDETFVTLRRKHQEVAARLLIRAAIDLRDGSATPIPQAPEQGRQYYRMHPALRRVAEARLRDQRPPIG